MQEDEPNNIFRSKIQIDARSLTLAVQKAEASWGSFCTKDFKTMSADDVNKIKVVSSKTGWVRAQGHYAAGPKGSIEIHDSDRSLKIGKFKWDITTVPLDVKANWTRNEGASSREYAVDVQWYSAYNYHELHATITVVRIN